MVWIQPAFTLVKKEVVYQQGYAGDRGACTDKGFTGQGREFGENKWKNCLDPTQYHHPWQTGSPDQVYWSHTCQQQQQNGLLCLLCGPSIQ